MESAEVSAGLKFKKALTPAVLCSYARTKSIKASAQKGHSLLTLRGSTLLRKEKQSFSSRTSNRVYAVRAARNNQIKRRFTLSSRQFGSGFHQDTARAFQPRGAFSVCGSV
ncbi:MAG: hypothetical protein JEZ04_04965 [Spirochaetales bacterium]|nr:hypothetical protein [Spirochaetales bacterium]